MRGMILVLGTALTLAACNHDEMRNQGEAMEDAVENAASNVSEDNATNYQAAVIALPREQRDIVFIRAISDAGLKCQSVTESTRLPDDKGTPVWRARCSNGGAHLISITKDGTANIITRADA